MDTTRIRRSSSQSQSEATGAAGAEDGVGPTEVLTEHRVGGNPVERRVRARNHKMYLRDARETAWRGDTSHCAPGKVKRKALGERLGLTTRSLQRVLMATQKRRKVANTRYGG